MTPVYDSEASYEKEEGVEGAKVGIYVSNTIIPLWDNPQSGEPSGIVDVPCESNTTFFPKNPTANNNLLKGKSLVKYR